MFKSPTPCPSIQKRHTTQNANQFLKVGALGLCLLATGASALGQQPIHKPAAMTHSVVVPSSGRLSVTDLGKRVHTNVRFLSSMHFSPNEAPPYAGYGYETPASLACLYKLVKPIPGCNPNSTVNTPSGGSQSIAIVDAYDDPNAASDLAAFSSQFGLPYSDAKFKVVYAGGSKPPEDPTGGWELEESLDIEYTHAMAPKATIYLVEANSNYNSDLYPAIQVASNLVLCGKTTTCPAGSKGQGQVTMSFGSGEFPQETQLDSYFLTPNVVYFASSGDEAGVEYPCASPNVVCVGGTSTARSQDTGDFLAEIAWSDAGGGVSYYEPIPGFQKGFKQVASQTYGYRGVPDISSDANPNTGAWVLDTFPYNGEVLGWLPVGGTSLASPTMAGIINASGTFRASSNSLLYSLYGHYGAVGKTEGFFDVNYGACGYYSGSFSSTGWDLCTGLGSPRAINPN